MTKSSVIKKIPNIINKGEEEAKKILRRIEKPTLITEEIIRSIGNNDNLLKEKIARSTNNALLTDDLINQFILGDNLFIVEALLKEGFKEKIDLIYIDPPFLTGMDYKYKINLISKGKPVAIEQFAYTDIWERGLVSYLEIICPRLYLLRELLSNEGSIYVHLDWRVVHYVKILMDEIFGEENFLNEIIWSYKSGGASKKHFSRKHDTILLYSKTKNYIFNPQKEKSYNRGFKPYRFKGVKEYEDEIGWYTLVNAKDVWNVDMVGRTSKERVGYATQKPEKLLERIILSSSNEDSIVGDFFAGSGTTGIVADKLNRKWVLTDIGESSALTIKKRLINNEINEFLFRRVYKDEESNKSNKDKRDNRNGITIDFVDRKINGEQETIIIKIQDYKLDIKNLSLNKKDKKIVSHILKDESLALIDYISIDPDFKGEVPIFSWQKFRKDEKSIISNNIKLKLSKKEGNRKLFIKIIDVFGNNNDIIIDT